MFNHGKNVILKLIDTNGNEIQQQPIKVKEGSIILIKIKNDTMPIESVKVVMDAFRESFEGDNPALAYYQKDMELQVLETEDNINSKVFAPDNNGFVPIKIRKESVNEIQEQFEFKKYVKKNIPIKAAQMDMPFVVETLKGWQRGKVGDFLMIGAHNEMYVCDKDIHSETYEEYIE